MTITKMIPDSAVSITLVDQTSHYYGGYYHVKLLAYCDITLERNYFETEAQFSEALEKLGEAVRFEKVLEKMAVPESGIASVRDELLQNFDKTTRAYLAVPDFARRFVLSEFQKCGKKSLPIRSPRA